MADVAKVLYAASKSAQIEAGPAVADDTARTSRLRLGVVAMLCDRFVFFRNKVET